MSKGSVRVDPPKDPDPAPRVVTQNSTEIIQAQQKARRDAANSYGRQATILTGVGDGDESKKKKTILGD
ncbi:MAG: hypothetical protein MJ016_02190 [Victivallaceae bacterium]|nr:hypothetical protein [Victivallaceae bacterium]